MAVCSKAVCYNSHNKSKMFFEIVNRVWLLQEAKTITHSKIEHVEFPPTWVWIEFDFSGGHEMIQKRIPVYNAMFQRMGLLDFVLRHNEGETDPLKKYYIQTCSSGIGYWINPDEPGVKASADYLGTRKA